MHVSIVPKVMFFCVKMHYFMAHQNVVFAKSFANGHVLLARVVTNLATTNAGNSFVVDHVSCVGPIVNAAVCAARACAV